MFVAHTVQCRDIPQLTFGGVFINANGNVATCVCVPSSEKYADATTSAGFALSFRCRYYNPKGYQLSLSCGYTTADGQLVPGRSSAAFPNIDAPTACGGSASLFFIFLFFYSLLSNSRKRGCVRVCIWTGSEPSNRARGSTRVIDSPFFLSPPVDMATLSRLVNCS